MRKNSELQFEILIAISMKVAAIVASVCEEG
jgi:hypothetical protein